MKGVKNISGIISEILPGFCIYNDIAGDLITPYQFRERWLMQKNLFMLVSPGIHEVLRRQGLLENIFCLNPE
ncbi:MAG: hypothetical protein ACXWWC_11440 [Chitinophagaceae bacterium]